MALIQVRSTLFSVLLAESGRGTKRQRETLAIRRLVIYRFWRRAEHKWDRKSLSIFFGTNGHKHE
jgi:hypothetical protein